MESTLREIRQKVGFQVKKVQNRVDDLTKQLNARYLCMFELREPEHRRNNMVIIGLVKSYLTADSSRYSA